MKKYGLQLRVPPPAKKATAAPGASSLRPPPPPPPAFGDDGDDDVEREIARQALKSRQQRQVEEQHRKALEEDPTAFAYDEVFEEMKEQIARPKIQDKAQRESKYIGTLMQAAKKRAFEQDIVYDKKLMKERKAEDHMYADKEKFVTSAYKKKLQERAQWEAEEKLRKLREEKEDVTKQADLSNFYFGLSHNVAFGAQTKEDPKVRIQNHPEQVASSQVAEKPPRQIGRESMQPEADSHTHGEDAHAAVSAKSPVPDATPADDATPAVGEAAQAELKKITEEQYQRGADVLSSAKERYLARKKARKADDL